MSTCDEGFLACHRGVDKEGTMSAQWFLVDESTMSLEAAMQACQQLIDSGLLYHPQASQFRICRPDGTVAQESMPPHAASQLTWASPASTRN